MDSEDRDHFKTIRNPSAERSIGSPARSQQEPSRSRQGPDWFQSKAKAICGCYRRDEAQDPETFAAALAVVLGDYPTAIVEYAADPRTGVITKFPMGLPNIGQIKQFLDDLRVRQDRINRYAALPKMQRHIGPPVKAKPNLFVPDTAHRYAAMARRHEKDTEGRSRAGAQVCQDGVRRNGLFVPLNWFEDGAAMGDDALAAAARRVFERVCAEGGIDPAGGVSPVLMANIKAHEINEGDEHGTSYF